MKLPFFLASRFVAAETLDETLPIVRDLNTRGLNVALDMLGEYVRDRNVALAAKRAYIEMIETIAVAHDTTPIRVHPSIKLSMIGQKIDESFCRDNLFEVLEAAKAHDRFVCFDMEGSDLTESTLSLFEDVYPDFPDHCGVVLQAYLHRTVDDIERMCELNARVRICKGAYKEPSEIAYQDMPTIREHYLTYAQALITRARFPGIATHDDLLINAVKQFAADEAISHDDFEFQMLYGIRPDTQAQIAQDGYNMRVYVPYGTQWLPYFTRRLRERKENVWFVLSNIFRR